MSQTKNVSFITSSANEDLFYNSAVKEKLKELLKVEDDNEYDKVVENGIVLSVDIFVKNTKISINEESYNDLIENTVYSTQDTRVYSLRVKDSGISGVLSLRIGGID